MQLTYMQSFCTNANTKLELSSKASYAVQKKKNGVILQSSLASISTLNHTQTTKRRADFGLITIGRCK